MLSFLNNARHPGCTPSGMQHWYTLLAKVTLTLIALPFLALSGCDTQSQSESSALRIGGGVPFFYYHDLSAAANWYEHKLGLRKVADEGWVVIMEITATSFIGLVNATDGTLQPATKKDALLSIETPDLEAWYTKLAATTGSNITQGIEIGAKGKIEEFRMQDPGGYVVEFFRWRDRACSHAGKGKTITTLSGSDACPITHNHVHN